MKTLTLGIFVIVAMCGKAHCVDPLSEISFLNKADSQLTSLVKELSDEVGEDDFTNTATRVTILADRLREISRTCSYIEDLSKVRRDSIADELIERMDVDCLHLLTNIERDTDFLVSVLPRLENPVSIMVADDVVLVVRSAVNRLKETALFKALHAREVPNDLIDSTKQ